MLYLNLIIIAFLAVFIVDYSGFIEEMDKALTKVLKSKFSLHIPKPFSCSLCLTWWCGLIYLIIAGGLSFVSLGVLGLLCCLTPELLSIIHFVKDIVNKVFDTIERLLNITVQ